MWVSVPLHVCMQTTCMSGTHECQKRASNSLGIGVTEDYEPPCGYWKFNPEPLEEQPACVTPESTLQPKLTLKELVC